MRIVAPACGSPPCSQLTSRLAYGSQRAFICVIFAWLVLLLCSCTAFAQSSQTGNTVGQSTLVATPAGRISGGLNPPYLNELPAVDLVRKTIQGSDPTDSLARQIAVFEWLCEVIESHVTADRRLRLLPDEAKVKAAYELAAYQIEEAYKKDHTDEEAKAFFHLHGRYSADHALYQDMKAKLLSPQAVAEQQATRAAVVQHLQQHNDEFVRQQQQTIAKAQAASGKPAIMTSTDPAAVALRRCLEMGGSELDCGGRSLSNGSFSMLGMGNSADLGQQPTGLVILGDYQGASTTWLSFSLNKVSVMGCGKLDHAYTYPFSLTRRGASLVVQVENHPRPYSVVLGPDGSMRGPGPVAVQGQIIIGYHHYNVVRRRVSDGAVVGQTPVSEPIYRDAVGSCSIGALRAPGPVTVASLSNAVPGLLKAIGDQTGGDLGSYPAGLRLSGTYAGPDGLQLAFGPDEVITDCGPAHAARPYTVEITPADVLIKIGNGKVGSGSPLTLAFQPNGTLAGSGTAEVFGRLIVGNAPGGGFAYSPTRASCRVSTLAPRTK